MADEHIKVANIVMPNSYFPIVNEKVKAKSVVAALSAAKPQTFSNANYLVFTDKPHGEFVGEGEAKSPSTAKATPVVGKPHKFQTTVRMNEEVLWTDEDAKLAFLDEVVEALSDSVAEGLDYGLIHGWNPLTKAAALSLSAEALTAVAHKVTGTGDLQADIDGLADKVIESGYRPSGIALDLMHANELRKLRVKNTNAKVYPELTLALEPSNFDGLPASVSPAVSGKELSVAGGPNAIIGNWDMIRWGYVRNFAVEQIKYGDPDGLGDLKRFNQVAYRVEAVFSWAILDKTAFAVLNASE